MNELQINNYPVPLVHRPELISLSGAKLRFRPDILKADGVVLELPTGISILAGIKIAMRESGHKISLRGAKIYFAADFPGDILKPLPREEWVNTLIGPTSLVNLIYPVYGGSGGKNPFATILSIVVMVAAVVVGNVVGGMLGGGLLGGIGGGLAAAAVGIAGSLIINAIAPPSKAKLTQANTNADSVWSIDGMRNRAALYEPIPWVLGKVRFAPRYGANPYTFLKGNNQFARYLFVTLGHNKVENMRIGDTDISRFKDIRYKVWENWQGEALSFFPASVYEEALNIKLNESGNQFRTTTQDTEEVQVEFYMPKGLGEINRSGELNSHTVSVSIAYRAAGTEEWKAWFADQAVSGGSLQIDVGAAPTHTPASQTNDRGRVDYLPGATSYSRKGSFTLYANSIGDVGFSGNYVLASGSWTANWQWEDVGTWQNPKKQWVYKSTTIAVSNSSRFSGTITTSGKNITISSGAYREFSRNITKATVTPQRFGFTKDLPVGQYEIRVSSGSANYDYNPDNQIFNEIYWNVLRSVRTGPVLRYQGVPMTVVELEIKATDQLNGHVEEFNAEFSSYAPVWNEETEEWEDAPSSNPASLGLLLATSPVIHKETSDPWAAIDIDAWVRFYAWCKNRGWQYNSVQTSEECAGEVLYNILASSRAAFSFKNGSKLSVTWDNTDKPVSYVFGPRNSWGFTSHKTFKKERTHGLRCLFLNEQKDYQEDERIVYNDGYTAENATNIIQKDFDGVTNPGLIYRLARLTMADEVWRPETYTLSTDYAFLNVAKGDLVRVAHYVPMWGVVQARVSGLVYDEEDTDKVVAVRIDEHVTMEAGKEYAFNWYPSGNECHSYSVETEEGTTTVLKLPMPLPMSQVPEFMGLVNFGLADRIDHDCIVTAVEPGDNFTATITLQDYSAEAILAAMTGPIPSWDSGITIPSRWQLGKPGTPKITIVNTDEHVLRRSDDGSFIPRIQVGFIVPEKDGVNVIEVRVQVRPVSASQDNQEEWMDAGRANAGAGFVYAEGVQERVEYNVRIAAVSSTGVVSDFSTVYTATVIGRTTPPPAPINLRLEGNKLAWQLPENVPMDVRGWEIWMGMDAEDPFSYAKKISNPYTPIMEFDISAWAGWARRAWVRTIDDIGLTSEPVYYVLNLGDVPVQNVVYEILESERGWPGTVQKGTRVAGTGLLSFAGRTTWGDSTMWGSSPMWGGDVLQMVYTTYMRVPAEAITSRMKIIPILNAGFISSIEWEIAESYQMWGDSAMWGELPFMGIQSSNDWLPLSNETIIDKEFVIGVRITFATTEPAIVPDIHWVFDVEDEEEKYNGILVEAAGTRIPVEERRFRWIKGVTFGLSQTEEEANAVRVIRGKGTETIEDGYVMFGPVIYCFDENNNPVEGRVDALVQGAKGDLNYG